ncbi:MAG: HlyD family efflux transporter periplasmic adaptor subunit [Planctomycetes bacterium]|nr:HlyD family efflux transporter periplasmic adaptor subunit [Planctomycetota bacterium]
MTAVRLLGCLAVVVLLGGADRPEAAKSNEAVLQSCFVKVQYEARIPAPVAGVLIDMQMQEGSRVKKGDALAIIDDREAAAALKIAQYGHQAAVKRADDQIEEKYAKKAAEVAYYDWQQDLKANKDHPGAIPDIEVRQKHLVFERSGLQIEKAQKDRELSLLDADTKKAELDAAQMAIDWRKITSPVDGEVVTTYRNQDEWVSPGDPILKLVRFDVLDVEGDAYAGEFDRGELLGRPVTVYITKARGREVSVKGSIVHVSQLVQSDGSYVVRAEIKNKREGDSWLIQPGVEAKMVIHLE